MLCFKWKYEQSGSMETFVISNISVVCIKCILTLLDLAVSDNFMQLKDLMKLNEFLFLPKVSAEMFSLLC